MPLKRMNRPDNPLLFTVKYGEKLVEKKVLAVLPSGCVPVAGLQGSAPDLQFPVLTVWRPVWRRPADSISRHRLLLSSREITLHV
jgi:hypothetical protein